MPQPQTKAEIPLTGFGGLLSEVAATDVPEGASPQCNDNDFEIGSVLQRPGQVSVYTYGDESAGPNLGSVAANASAMGAQWLNPGNILLDDLGYTIVNSPGAGSAGLNVKGFGFDLPSTVGISGVTVTIDYKQVSTGELSVQLLKDGILVGETRSGIAQNGGPHTITLGGAGDLWGTTWTFAEINNAQFGAQLVSINGTTTSADSLKIKIFLTPSLENFLYVKSFAPPSGSVETLALDAQGIIWGEDVINAPGVLDSLFTGITPGNYCKSVTQFSREYMCFSDLTQGQDIPRQYDGTTNFDRISQVGPGAPPAVGASSSGFDIVASPNGITQLPLRQTGWDDVMWSAGPGNTSPGNIITVYYTLGTQFGGLGGDQNLKVGGAMYIAGLSGDMSDANGTYLLLSTGVATPPGGSHMRFYFTYQVATTKFVHPGGGSPDQSSATYRIALATLNLVTPAVNVSVGDQVVLAGVTNGDWDGTWTISNALNGAQLEITTTSLNGTTGVATYDFTLVSGTVPVAGQIVTVTGTNNGDGIFNVVNQTINSVGSGSFTILLSGATIPSAGETGQGIINGTKFQFDPGLTTLGTMTDPIFGNSGGGTLATGGNVGSGTRQCCVLFLTRNGCITPASPPVTFQTVGSANSLTVTNIPIGGPEVIARIIAFTGANGAFFFYIPTPVTVTDNGQQVTYTATQINDNTSSQATFTFTDAVLLSAISIDTQGSDYISGIELGSCAWNISYASRMFYGGEQNKVDNIINYSFDGGFLSNPGGATLPLGWTVDPVNGGNGQLLVSPVYGNSYYISNTTGSNAPQWGMIEQTAFQDYLGVAIIEPNTTYSVRVTARCPSGVSSGTLTVDLFSPGTGISYPFTVALASMASNMQIFTGTMLTTGFPTVPADLLLRVYAAGLPNGGDVEIDRFEVFPTLEPVLGTQVRGSYVIAPEQFDGDTSVIGLASSNEEPCVGAFSLYDILYFLKTNSLLSTQDSPNSEPSGWNVHEVSNKVGACGPLAYDYGEEWAVMANRNGLYLFDGGTPAKLSQEIQPTWDAINWIAAKTIWVRNDLVNKRILVGVPLPTPNQWMPNAPVNLNPTSPNVVLTMNYREINSPSALASQSPVHVSFSGKLVSFDISRKWSPWTIACPYADFVIRPDTSTQLLMCNGTASSKIYSLSALQLSDDGAIINSVYTTFGFIKPDQEQQVGPLTGAARKMYRKMQLVVRGSGVLSCTFLANVLECYMPRSVPGGIQLYIPNAAIFNPGQFDRERKIDISANRLFLKFETNAVGSTYQLSKVLMTLAIDPMSPTTGGTY